MKDFSRKYYPIIILNFMTILIVALLVFVSQANAKPDRASSTASLTSGVLSYQGILLDTNGDPLTGSFEMTFRIYNVPSGGTPLWEEQRTGVNVVPVDRGLFIVMLGSLNPIPDSVWSSSELFLGVKVASDGEMSQREKLTLVPAAASANVAQLALSVPDGSITRVKLGADVNNYFIQSGDLSCDYNSCTGWTLHTGTGVRQYIKRITFPIAFSSPPKVVSNVHGFDLDYRVNSRMDVVIQNVTSTGFDVVFHTYADSIVYAVYSTWIAYGTK